VECLIIFFIVNYPFYRILYFIHNIKSEADLDEATGAYKDINVVMENQKDLVEIVEELTPLAVIKG